MLMLFLRNHVFLFEEETPQLSWCSLMSSHYVYANACFNAALVWAKGTADHGVHLVPLSHGHFGHLQSHFWWHTLHRMELVIPTHFERFISGGHTSLIHHCIQPTIHKIASPEIAPIPRIQLSKLPLVWFRLHSKQCSMSGTCRWQLNLEFFWHSRRRRKNVYNGPTHILFCT